MSLSIPSFFSDLLNCPSLSPLAFSWLAEKQYKVGAHDGTMALSPDEGNMRRLLFGREFGDKKEKLEERGWKEENNVSNRIRGY